MIQIFTDEINKYYFSKENPILNIKAEKPKYNIQPEFLSLINKLEATNKKGFSEICKFLLIIDREHFLEILNKINTDFSAPFEKLNTGLTYSKQTVTDKYIETFMLQQKVDKWYLITDIDGKLDFKIFNGFSNSKEFLQKELDNLTKLRLEQVKNKNIKIGRNDYCPCASGKKYKKCCLIYNKGDI